MSLLPSIYSLEYQSFVEKPSINELDEITKQLEEGNIVLLPNLKFDLNGDENNLFTDDIVDGSRKNVSFNPENKQVKGILNTNKYYTTISNMLDRYSSLSTLLIKNLCPAYNNNLSIGKTSFRPVEAKGRVADSVRKDDRLLHIDAFPSQPVQEKRILRVFTNINPNQQPRVWNVGHKMPVVKDIFCGRIRGQYPLESQLLKILHITKSKRTKYDHAMLQMHNTMKADLKWQQSSPRAMHKFPAGSTWIVYTDMVSHAALEGRYLLEQTFYPSVKSMLMPELSPQMVLAKYYNYSLEKMIS